MREFLNAPNGKLSSPVNTRSDADLSQSPLCGRTVCQNPEKRFDKLIIMPNFIW